MSAPSPSRLAEIVAEFQTRTATASDRLLKTFSFVPDDKLKWSPAATARTALALVAHCAQGNHFFALTIRGELPSPIPTAEEIHALERRFEASIVTRAEAVRQLEASRAEVLAALGAMTPERCASSPDTPFGQLPMSFWMGLPASHMEGHAAQVDYLQTVWGDLADHM